MVRNAESSAEAGEQGDDERSTPRDERRRDGEVQRPQPRGEARERRRRTHRGARRHLRGGRDQRREWQLRLGLLLRLSRPLHLLVRRPVRVQ